MYGVYSSGTKKRISDNKLLCNRGTSNVYASFALMFPMLFNSCLILVQDKKKEDIAAFFSPEVSRGFLFSLM